MNVTLEVHWMGTWMGHGDREPVTHWGWQLIEDTGAVVRREMVTGDAGVALTGAFAYAQGHDLQIVGDVPYAHMLKDAA